ncbi:DNA polymerase domain-containing protein [Methanomassiliicoccus luminyensis]|uniref:DNA polymerase domain-containing protein n=1 Tax=Methanomassiliicoccus luminyensis TaxID=1080712 RepID=UPI000371CA1A|nr:DNA polymerase domain-containing protein [Methanomassiliicoccus luminyensis]
MKGWVLDCYADHETNRMVTWFKTNSGAERIEEEFVPRICVRAPQGRTGKLVNDLAMIGVKGVSKVRRRTGLGEEKREVLSIAVPDYSSIQPLAVTIDMWGGYRDYLLYDVDLRMDQRYFTDRKIFPMGLTELPSLRSLDSNLRIDYPIPRLRSVDLGVRAGGGSIPTFGDPIASVTVDGAEIDGPEDKVIGELQALIRKRDPDVIYTRKGDSFVLPYLQKRAEANGMELELGRDRGRRTARGKSYFTYGRILYKPPAYKLRGRVHIDRETSFIFAESGMHGLIELSRLSLITIQDLSRMSPGSAISSMQINEALRTGHVVQWKKNRPEDFKTAMALIASDRGGFIYEPKVGVHGGVWEVDFFSLYPSIMVRHNISPETMMCGCCPQSRHVVPELGYRICERRTGLIPHVLVPVLKRRRLYKDLKNKEGAKREMYEQRSKMLKWLLVTCFGYTGYRNARFGRIECHEAINAFGRDILVRSADLAGKRGFEVLHGIVDSLWLLGEGDIASYCGEVTREVGIDLQLEGRYDWIVFLPNISTGVGALNRYYGRFESGELKLRGIALRRRDTPVLVEDLQRDMLERLSEARDAASFLAAVPSSLDILDGCISKLRDGAVPVDRLILRKRISQRLEDYVQFNDSVAALRQLNDEGFELQPGQAVEYLILDPGSRSSRDRVRAAPFLEGSERYDAERYVDLALRGAGELLSPFGWAFEDLRARDEGRSKKGQQGVLPAHEEK